MPENHKYAPFESGFDEQLLVGPEPGNVAYFGRDVLSGLVTGIEDFVAERQTRWQRRGSRDMGTGLLACAPWFTDVRLAQAVTFHGLAAQTNRGLPNQRSPRAPGPGT